MRALVPSHFRFDRRVGAALVLFASLALSATPARGEDAERLLELHEAIAEAMRSNPRLSASRVEVRRAAAAIVEAEKPFDTALTLVMSGGFERAPIVEARLPGVGEGPRVTGTIAYQHRLQAGTLLRGEFTETFHDVPNPLFIQAPEFRSTLSLKLEQPLARGAGSSTNRALIDSASAHHEADELALKFEAERLAAEVAVAYWELAQAQSELEIQNESVELAMKLEELTEQLVRRGARPPRVLDQARAALALRRAEYLAAERNAQERAMALSQAMLLPEDIARLHAADSLPPPNELPEVSQRQPTRLDVEAALKRVDAESFAFAAAEDRARPLINLGANLSLFGLGGQPTIQGCENYAVDLEQVGGGNALLGLPPLQLALPDEVRSRIPTGCLLDGPFTGGIGTSLENLFTGKYFYVGATLTLEIPFGNRGARAEVDRARLAVRRAREEVSAAERAANSQTRGLLRTARIERKRLEASQEAHRLARDLLELEEKSYRLSNSTLFDLVRVQEDLVQARLLESRARLDVAVTDARLAAAQGNLLAGLGLELVATEKMASDDAP